MFVSGSMGASLQLFALPSGESVKFKYPSTDITRQTRDAEKLSNYLFAENAFMLIACKSTGTLPFFFKAFLYLDVYENITANYDIIMPAAIGLL